MRRIAVTGVSGYIGTLLARRLSAHPDVDAIIGVDSRTPRDPPPKLRFYMQDVTGPMDDLFAAERVDAAVHLAFVVRPRREEWDTRRINVEGTRNLLHACLQAGVRQIVYFSSAAAYGAHPDNPVPLTEEHPLRPNPGFQYAVDKAATDEMMQEYARARHEARVTILRGCPVIGPGGLRAMGAKIFQPVMIKLAGHDPAVQFIHEDDVGDILTSVLERPVPGVYNIAGNGYLRYTDLARLAGRPMIALPKRAVSAAMSAGWRLRLQGQSPPAGLDFIAYPWVVDNGKLKAATGYRYRYTGREAVLAYLQSRWRKPAP